jgi:hypothetical protein
MENFKLTDVLEELEKDPSWEEDDNLRIALVNGLKAILMLF